MAMAMVRRRIAGYAKVKTKRIPVPRRPRSSDPDEQMVGEEAIVRVYAPRAAVGRSVEAKPWWHGLWKPLAIGSGVAAGCLIAFFVMKSPDRSDDYSSAQRPEYPRSASLPHARVVGASAARHVEASSAGTGGSTELVLSNRSAQTDDSFRATGYARKKVYLPDISGNCTGSGQEIAECLRRQAGG